MREQIAENLVDTLEDITDPAVQFVTRDSFDPDELSNHQFPAIMVTSSNEELVEDHFSGTETVQVSYALECYVKGDLLDEARNELIDAVRDKLYEDRHRDNNAINTKVASVEIDDGSIAPIGGAIIVVNVTYDYGA